MLFMAGVKSRAELDAIAAAVTLPLFLGSAGKELYDLDYLSARNVRVCLQGHTPIMAAINAVHATLKALREGKPGWEFENISPPSELMKRATRQADYAAWSSDFLKAGG
jgi:carboxyvinyl-carboxyphosphonate phosphorylmutase